MCTVVPDMKLSPNVGSDRSWVWNAAADVSEGEPEAQTLAIRFANSESTYYQPTARERMLISRVQTPTASRRLSSRPSKRTRRCSARERRSRRFRLQIGTRRYMEEGMHARTTAVASRDGIISWR
jgi:hypothetical protein